MFIFQCSFPSFHPYMSCQQTLIGKTVSNLKNGSLKYSFEIKNIIRHRQRGRHKRKESSSDVCSVYQALHFCSPKIIGNMSTPTNTSENPPTDLHPIQTQVFFPLSLSDFLDFVTLHFDMTGFFLKQMADTSFRRPRTEFALRAGDVHHSHRVEGLEKVTVLFCG